MLSGVGELGIFTLDQTSKSLGQDIFFPGQFFNFVYAGESQKKEAKAWVGGKRKTISSAVGDESYTLTLSFQYLDWTHLSFAYDEIPQTSDNVMLPFIKTVTVPSAAPYEITDNEISTENVDSIKVYAPNRNTLDAGFRKRVTGASSPHLGQFKVADQKIIFSVYDAGQTLQYSINRYYASIESIGYEAEANDWGKLSFLGRGYGPEFPRGVLIYLPNITRSSIPSIDTSADVPEFSIEFTANVPAGKRTPHQFFNLSTAAYS